MNLFTQKQAVPKTVLLSSDEDEAPASRTRSKSGKSKPKARQRASPRTKRSPAKRTSSPHRDAVTQRNKADPPVAVSPPVSATPYNLRHTVPHVRPNPAVITSPQTYSTPQDLRRHVLNQQHRHNVTLTPEIGSSPSSSHRFQRSSLLQQHKSMAREVFSTSLLSSDEESELDLSAKPSKNLSRRQLRSSTKAKLLPPPQVDVATTPKPAKPTPVQRLPKVPPKPVVAEKQTKPCKPDVKPAAPVAANGSPGWMHLGWAEFFLALVVVAIITLSLWLYQQKFRDE